MLKCVFVVGVTSLFAASVARGQVKSIDSNPSQIQRFAAVRESEVNAADFDPHQKLQQELTNRVILERQIQLLRDTEKLLALAAELKTNVQKTNSNVLSMDVIKKAQEIQKLAKSVQDKMKNPY